MSRQIDFTDYPMAHQPILNWIRANGLNPKHLPYDQTVEVGHGRLWVTKFLLDSLGKKRISDSTALTERVTVPLISAPETHGL